VAFGGLAQLFAAAGVRIYNQKGMPMKLMKLLVLTWLGAAWLGTSAYAQSTNGFRTDIEAFEAQTNVIIIKGFGLGGTVSAGDGILAVHLKESYSPDTGNKLQAMVLDFNEGGTHQWAVIDYSEIGPLLKGLDYVRAATYDVTGLPSFEVLYQTKDGFRVIALGTHRQSSVQTFIQFDGFPRILLNSDQMSQLSGVIGQAQTSLDELKQGK
jgi:hypothetical protein